MARAQARYVCQQCGSAHPKWAGRCDACGGWNTLVEEVARESAPKGLGGAKGRKLAFAGLDGAAQALPRRISGNCAKHQRKVSLAISRARSIALLPFTQAH